MPRRHWPAGTSRRSSRAACPRRRGPRPPACPRGRPPPASAPPAHRAARLPCTALPVPSAGSTPRSRPRAARAANGRCSPRRSCPGRRRRSGPPRRSRSRGSHPPVARCFPSVGWARRCVVPPWRDGGQARYIERPVPEPAATRTAATRVWALARLGDPLTLADLAGHARMSLRTFARRFDDEVGMSPGRRLIQQRVARARHLLGSQRPLGGPDRRRGRLRDRHLAAPAPARGDRRLAGGLPAHVPSGALSTERSPSLARTITAPRASEEGR